MEIIDRNPTPDRYSIKDISVQCRREYENHVSLYLTVSLEPAYYQRNRFGNNTTAKKKNPCTLRIPLEEVFRMEGVLRNELRDCHEFIVEQDLLVEWFARKHAPVETIKKAG